MMASAMGISAAAAVHHGTSCCYEALDLVTPAWHCRRVQWMHPTKRTLTAAFCSA